MSLRPRLRNWGGDLQIELYGLVLFQIQTKGKWWNSLNGYQRKYINGYTQSSARRSSHCAGHANCIISAKDTVYTERNRTHQWVSKARKVLKMSDKISAEPKVDSQLDCSALALQQIQNLFIYVDGTTRQRISKRELKFRIIEIANTLRGPNDQKWGWRPLDSLYGLVRF